MGIKIEEQNNCKYIFEGHSNYVYTDKSSGPDTLYIMYK